MMLFYIYQSIDVIEAFSLPLDSVKVCWGIHSITIKDVFFLWTN